MNIPHVKDKYYITYGIFYLLGILTFIPNYFVITASRYWMYKFRHIPTRPPNKDDDPTFGPPSERTVLQASFMSSYYIVTQLSLVLFIIITAAYSKKLPPPEKRISAALLCTLVFYVVNLAFCKIVTDSFQLAFFALGMCIASCLTVCGAVIIVSLFEMVSKFPSEYFAALLTGQALCGVIAALILILTIIVSSHPITNGLIFFAIGTDLVLLTNIVYWYSKRNSQYFIYHVGNDRMTETDQHTRFFPRICAQIRTASRHTKFYMASLIIVFGTTAMVYPGLMSLIAAENSNGQTGSAWNEMYFVPVITFLVANICDLTGRILATKIKKPERGSVILAMAIVRLGFIPIMMFCNALPRFNLPVIFFDAPYIAFTIVFAFSHGYLINLCVTVVPTRAQNEEEKGLITVMAVLSGILSTAICSFLSLVLVHIL